MMSSTLRRPLLLWAALILVLVGLWARDAAQAHADSTPRLHPAVEAFARQHPGELIPVIVQTKGSPERLAALVRARGGADVDELKMIEGFSALVAPDEAERLARDANVEWVSLDAPVVPSGREEEVDASDLATAYPFAANAVPAWERGVTGERITVAVIDTGIRPLKDFRGRIVGHFGFTRLSRGWMDRHGHGTFVAGIIAGSSEEYIGIAPGARLLSLKVAGRQGYALVSDVIEALQWVVDHRDRYDIRVVNISLTSTIADSYRLDPLDAAVEQAWFKGIVVVTAAGNHGTEPFSVDYAPANDPYVITVGALDARGTPEREDDALAAWSSRGLTVDGYGKPEIVAPGVNIVSTLSGRDSYLARNLKEALVDGRHIRLTGTSASAAVVSGVVALMLQRDPELTPDQVKYRLVISGMPLEGSAAPRVDALAAVFSEALGEANQGAAPNELIDPATGEIMYDSVLWRSVLWRSVLCRSVLWRSVLWRY